MKKISIIILIIVIAAGAYALSGDWLGNNNMNYENAKYGYSLQYPEHWNMRGSAQSDILQFFTADNPPGDGGLPNGIKMEVMALENYDDLSLNEWVDQMTTGGMGGEEVGKEQVKVGGITTIRVTSAPMFENEGPSIAVYMERGDRIVFLQYMGSQPDYSDNLGNFETLLRSFSF